MGMDILSIHRESKDSAHSIWRRKKSGIISLKYSKVSADCKYGNCTHRHEPGCAVREAVERHLISESRYTSYLNMLEDKEEGKYRAAY